MNTNAKQSTNTGLCTHTPGIAISMQSCCSSLSPYTSATGKMTRLLSNRGKHVSFLFNPLPDNKVLDWSKLKQSADNNFEFDVNSRKFSKLVKNTVGKGEIAHYKQFLLFPQCFQELSHYGNGLTVSCVT